MPNIFYSVIYTFSDFYLNLFIALNSLPASNLFFIKLFNVGMIALFFFVVAWAYKVADKLFSSIMNIIRGISPKTDFILFLLYLLILHSYYLLYKL